MFASFLKVTSFYRDFLSDYYRSNPTIIGKSYEEQYKHLMAEGYGYADYFPTYFKKNYSLKSEEIIHNAVHLQKAWANEYGSRQTGNELLLEQIKAFRPEVLLIQDSANFEAGFVDRIRKEADSIRLMIGHVCAPYTARNLEAFSRFDVMLACSPVFQNELGKLVNTYLFPHAVESTLVSDISSSELPSNDIIFVGSFLQRSEFHRNRIAAVDKILESGLPMCLYGKLEGDPWHTLKAKQASYFLVKSAEKLGIRSVGKIAAFRKMIQLKEMPRKTRYPVRIREHVKQEQLFGKKMLNEIARHAVGLNIHGEVAGDYAANVRLFEVAGAGAMLCTDHKKNIRDLYEPDAEILTYNSVEECIEKLKWALEHPREAANIAEAGQKRTLKDHSVENRVDLLWEIMRNEHSK